MGLLGFLIICYGVFGISCGSKCVPETAKCSQYWIKIEPHKHLMESKEELDAWCRQQPRFYECLESVLLADKNGNISHLPTNLLISKLFAEDLCTEDSTSRRRYLNNAACINQLNTEFCTEPEYLDIVTPDDGISPSRCSPSEKAFSCIAASMVINCGFDAGRVYRNLLKITQYSEEVCDIEISSGIPPCDERKSKDTNRNQKFSEIYYGLVDRIGSIPEQDVSPVDDIVSNEVNEPGKLHEDDAITEAIKIALDFLDHNELSEEAVAEPLHLEAQPNSNEEQALDLEEQSHRNEVPVAVSRQGELYKKHPLITQVYRDIIFYNYSGLEYAFYWRQPAFTIFENVSCEHLQPSYLRGIIFRCIIEYRTRDPDCVSKATVHEPVTPELIRDIDPEVPDDSTTEFGPRPDWMKDMDDAYEEKRLRDQLKSTTESPEDNPRTDSPGFSTTSSTLLHLAEAVTKPPEPEWWEVTHTMLLPDDIKNEMMELLMPEPEKYVPPPMNMYQIGNSMFIFIYDPMTNAIENMTCSRLDECHPRGKGLFKCKMMRRKIEVCDVCYGGTGAYIEGLPASLAPSSEEQKQTFKVPETTDPIEEPEGSGLSEVSPEEKLIALVFSGDVQPETSEEHGPVHAEVDESNYLRDRAFDTELERSLESSDADEDSSVRLVVLDNSLLDTDDVSTYVPELVYEIGSMGVMDNEQISEEASSSGSNYGLLNENIILLRSVPSVGDVEDEYTILNSSDELQNQVF